MENNRSKQLFGSVMLALASIFWGTAFAEQRMAAEHMQANTLNSLRFLIGGVILLTVVIGREVLRRRSTVPDGKTMLDRLGGKKLLVGGAIAGVVTFISSYLQQKGLETVGAGKSGFITSLYIVLVPIFAIALKKKTSFINWVGVLVAMAGMSLMCLSGVDAMQVRGPEEAIGCIFLFGCAIMFAVQILIIDVCIGDSDALAFSCVQELACGICGAIPMLLLERPEAADIMAGIGPLLYLGIFSCAIAYTLQVVGQKYVPAQAATLLMSLESVFAAVAGVIILREMMSVREVLGAAIMLAAVLMVQLYPQKK